MKILLLIIASSLLFLSCSSDDDSGNCFDCRTSGIKIQYCKSGDNYTVTTIGMGVTHEYPLGDQSWEEFKAEMEELCEQY